DQLDENVDVRIARERRRLGEPFHFLEIDAAVLVARSCADGNDVDGTPATSYQRVALMRDLGKQCGANRAQPGDAHFQRWWHNVRARCERRVASGTTLCSCSGAWSRKRRTLRAAWRIRCSFSTSATRTYPSPYSPKPMPGDTAISAFSTSSLENSMLPSELKGSGIGAHANIDARGDGTCQPARPKLSTRTSRRRL